MGRNELTYYSIRGRTNYGKESLMKNSVWAINAVDKCRERAYFSKNKKFSALWTKIADELEVKYLSGQPWLRTYDGKLK